MLATRAAGGGLELLAADRPSRGVARQARPKWAAVASDAGRTSGHAACPVRDDGEVVQETVGPVRRTFLATLPVGAWSATSKRSKSARGSETGWF
jgi:hypothetical protein